VSEATIEPETPRPSDVLLDLELPFALTLGSVELSLGELHGLEPGAVLPLGRAADGPVNLVVGGRTVARGELVVVDGCFGIRVATVETAERRLSSLGRV
jgi:flagellar motor switch protein FliN/FliY